MVAAFDRIRLSNENWTLSDWPLFQFDHVLPRSRCLISYNLYDSEKSTSRNNDVTSWLWIQLLNPKFDIYLFVYVIFSDLLVYKIQHIFLCLPNWNKLHSVSIQVWFFSWVWLNRAQFNLIQLCQSYVVERFFCRL